MQRGMSVFYVAGEPALPPICCSTGAGEYFRGGLQAVQADEDVVGTSRSVSWNGWYASRSVRSPARPQDDGGKKTELAAAVVGGCCCMAA